MEERYMKIRIRIIRRASTFLVLYPDRYVCNKYTLVLYKAQYWITFKDSSICVKLELNNEIFEYIRDLEAAFPQRCFGLMKEKSGPTMTQLDFYDRWGNRDPIYEQLQPLKRNVSS